VRTILAYLAAAALTLHVLLGCCLHHDHPICLTGACCELHGEAAVGEDQGRHDDHEGHDHDSCPTAHEEHDRVAATEHESEPDHTPAEPCPGSCGDRCVFVSTVRFQLEQPLDLASFDLSLLALPQVAANLRLGGTRFESLDATADPPPLRLHLLQQRLLI
jgi:hypothetical protein